MMYSSIQMNMGYQLSNKAHESKTKRINQTNSIFEHILV